MNDFIKITDMDKGLIVYVNINNISCFHVDESYLFYSKVFLVDGTVISAGNSIQEIVEKIEEARGQI